MRRSNHLRRSGFEVHGISKLVRLHPLSSIVFFFWGGGGVCLDKHREVGNLHLSIIFLKIAVY